MADFNGIQNVPPRETSSHDYRETLSAPKLFSLFTHISMIGFGGVLPSVFRVLVEKRKLLSASEFREVYAFAQILPGASICNLAVIIGYRHAGIRGAIASLAGMIIVPSLIVIFISMIYRQYGANLLWRNALSGMAAVAAGLIVAMGITMARTLATTWRNVLFAGLMFTGVALLRLPLITVLVVLAPLAVLVYRNEGKS